MSQTIEAIFADGVFRPLNELQLPDQQHVRLTFEAVNTPRPDRLEAMRHLIEGFRRSNLRLNGLAPRRDELYDRI